jgi:hypothetical protein
MTSQAGEFRVVVSGGVVGGRDPVAVAESFARLINVDAEKARQYLRGKRSIIKKCKDKATAMEYQVALTAIGVNTSIESPANAGDTRSISALKPAARAAPAQAAKARKPLHRRAPVNPASGATMVCPACDTSQPEGKKCPGCGVYVEKARMIRQADEFKAPDTPDDPPPRGTLARFVDIVAGAALIGTLAWTGITIAMQ